MFLRGETKQARPPVPLFVAKRPCALTVPPSCPLLHPGRTCSGSVVPPNLGCCRVSSRTAWAWSASVINLSWGAFFMAWAFSAWGSLSHQQMAVFQNLILLFSQTGEAPRKHDWLACLQLRRLIHTEIQPTPNLCGTLIG